MSTGASGGIGSGLVKAFLNEDYNLVASALNFTPAVTPPPSLVLILQ